MAQPTILAGPILRRVDKNKVSVWLAFSKPQSVTLNIYELDRVEDKSSLGDDLTIAVTNTPVFATTTTTTIQIGKNLFVALVTAEKAVLGFDVSKVYSYDVVFVGDDKQNLKSSNLLKDKGPRKGKALGYANNILPTFVLPADEYDKLYIAQGSCRKMHGYGEDALSYLDGILEKNVTFSGADLDERPLRPQQMFLTGDQIYADDVPSMLLQSIENNDLVGTEKIRIKDETGTIQDVEVNRIQFPCLVRKHLVAEYGNLTSEDASSHLISFEEYCSVYLNYWNALSWEDSLYKMINDYAGGADSKKEQIVDEILLGKAGGSGGLISIIKDEDNKRTHGQKFILKKAQIETFAQTLDTPSLKDWIDSTKRTLHKELRLMGEFLKTLPSVSRIMANIPCYMIFDDHEITDDWFISQNWTNKVFSSPLGRDIYRNGMMAYAIFQDWGNVPDEYSATHIAGEDADKLSPRTKFLRNIIEYGTHIGTDNKTNKLKTTIIPNIEILLGMTGNSPLLKWHYDVPSGRGHTYALDTRTRRRFDSLNAIPGLMDVAALEEQIPTTLPNGADFMMVISPTPALGLSSLEELIQPTAAAVLGIKEGDILKGIQDADVEAWGFHVEMFERLIERLSKFDKVIILSGDVHYGFSSMMDYWKRDNVVDGLVPISRIVQLTSSACKNMWLPNLEMLKTGLVQRILAQFHSKLEKIGWRNKVVTIEDGGYITPYNRLRLRAGNPTRTGFAVIPVEGWSNGTIVNEAPDYSWRLQVSCANTPPGLMDTDIVLTDVDSVVTGYEKIVEKHQETFLSGQSNQIIFPSNIGIISFTGTDGELSSVKHAFMYRLGKRGAGEGKVGSHTKHNFSFELTDEEKETPTLEDAPAAPVED
ncbi:MAG: hypothetical protein ACI85O_000129 [Saprospiraceae bacterium]|jgi:hypothetical protein